MILLILCKRRESLEYQIRIILSSFNGLTTPTDTLRSLWWFTIGGKFQVKFRMKEVLQKGHVEFSMRKERYNSISHYTTSTKYSRVLSIDMYREELRHKS